MSAVLKDGELAFRLMREPDMEAVMAIEQRCYSHPWTAGIFRDCLRVGYGCWVVERDGEIIGYGLLSIGAGEAHILNLCVDPDYQRCGYGRAMLEHLVARAAENGVRIVLLEVRPSNAGALRMYEYAGFSEVGLRHNYYPDAGGREDALILAREL